MLEGGPSNVVGQSQSGSLLFLSTDGATLISSRLLSLAPFFVRWLTQNVKGGEGLDCGMASLKISGA